MVDSHLLDHPYMARNKDVRKLINRASDALNKAYQLIGEKTLLKTDSPSTTGL
jgi:hypothetical protein